METAIWCSYSKQFRFIHKSFPQRMKLQRLSNNRLGYDGRRSKPHSLWLHARRKRYCYAWNTKEPWEYPCCIARGRSFDGRSKVFYRSSRWNSLAIEPLRIIKQRAKHCCPFYDYVSIAQCGTAMWKRIRQTLSWESRQVPTGRSKIMLGSDNLTNTHKTNKSPQV